MSQTFPFPLELQLYKANTSDTKASVLDLHAFVSNDIAATKIYDRHDKYDFEIAISQF